MKISHYGWVCFGFWEADPEDPSFWRMYRFAHEESNIFTYSLKLVYEN